MTCVICLRESTDDFCDDCLEQMRFFDAVPAALEMFLTYLQGVASD